MVLYTAAESTNMTWPPAAMDPIARDMSRWSAWFSGDPAQLTWAYQNQVGGNSRIGRAFFSTTGEASTMASRANRGNRNAVLERTFWGTLPPKGERRTKIHVPVANDIASMSADLLFAKRPRFDTDDATSATQQWLEDCFDDTLHSTLLEGGELCAGLGGVYLRTVYDTALADKPWIDLVHADSAVPTFTYGRLTSVIFWRVVEDTGDTVHRHLEQHDLQSNTVFHSVYVGDQQMLGTPAALADYRDLAHLTLILDSDNALHFPDLPGDACTVTYIPNMRPNRRWRGIPAAGPLGVSDYGGIEGLMDSFDETFSSWMRDIRLAKARLMVPPAYLENIGPGRGALADIDREVFVPLNLLAGTADGSTITANQFKIRFAEHQATLDETKTLILQSAGYSPQTFGDSPTAAMTATEVEDRQRRTLLTRARKLNYARPGLRDALYALMCLENTVFGRKDIVPIRPDITFPDAVMPSTSELAQTAVALDTAKAASRETLVAMVHPDWTAQQIDEEVARIRDESALEVLERARVTLAPPATSTATIGEDVLDIEAAVDLPTGPLPAQGSTQQELQP